MIKKEDIIKGVRFEVVNKPHLQNGTDLIVMGGDCDFFSGQGVLKPGAQVEIAEDGISHIAVRSALSLRFTIVGEPTGATYSTFWSFFRTRVKQV